MLHGLRTVVFMVADLDAAKRWYAEVTGRAPYFDEVFYVGFEVGGYELGLHPGAGSVGGSVVYFGVDDAEAAHARLVALGAVARQAVTDVGGGIRLGTVVDPFGNELGVITNPHFRPEVADAGRTGPVAIVERGASLAAAAEDLSDRAIVREVTVALPPARVWALWTTEAGLASWLAPATIDLRPGGRYEVWFDEDAPVGSRGGEGVRVLAFLPERMLAITWNAPPHLATTRDQRTQVVVEFTAVDGGTHVRLTHHGWPASGLADAASEWPATFAYFERAWGMVTQRLATAR